LSPCSGAKKTLTPCSCNSCGVSTPRLFSAHSNPSTCLVLVTAECRQRGALQHVVGRPHTAVTVQDLCNVGAGALANGHVKPGEVGRITNCSTRDDDSRLFLPAVHPCNSLTSSSTVRSAWRRIERSVPGGRSLLPWTGTTTNPGAPGFRR